jgi:hypothetical protein
VTVKDMNPMIRDRVGKVLAAVSLDLWSRITRKNPVDTGRSRAAWNLAINKIDRTVPAESGFPPPRPASADRSVKPRRPQPAIPAVGRIGWGDTVYVTNALPYVPRLETGHSKKQAPNGFVAISVEEVRARVGRLAR